MISVNFYLAVSLYMLASISVILVIWILGKKEKDKDLTLDPKFIWHCSVCSYTYINTKEDTISKCPRCGSYNKR